MLPTVPRLFKHLAMKALLPRASDEKREPLGDRAITARLVTAPPQPVASR